MNREDKVLAFIGARSGSKGLVDKNIRLFCGKPLIAWTIESALNCPFIDDVVVSTDSEKYAVIAHNYGAQVIMRPKALATDDADLMSAIRHSVDKLHAQGLEYDVVVNLQPTSPLRKAKHISEALSLYWQNFQPNLRVFSCYAVSNKYAWIMRADNNGFANFIDQAQFNSKHARQKNGQVLLPNGAIFIVPSTDLTQFYNGKTLPYVMSERESVDIDSLDDFKHAEQLFVSGSP